MKFSMYLNNFLEVANVISKSIGKDNSNSFESVDGKKVSEHTIFKVHQNKLIIQHRTSQSFFKGSVDFKDIDITKEELQARELQTKINELEKNTNRNEEEEKELDKLKLNMLKLFNFEVDSFQLRTILSIIPKDESIITFELSDNCRQFEIYTLHYKLKLPVYDTFQDTTKEEEITILGTVSANEFLSTISDLIKIVPNDNIVQKSPGSCLHIFGKKDKLVFMATNGIALVEKTINLEDSENDFTILVKPNLANLLLSSKFEVDDILSIYVTNTQIGIIDKFNTLCLVAKAGTNFEPLQYENFKQLFSREYTMTIQSNQFKNAVDNIAKLCMISNEEALNISPNKIVVENMNLDRIEMQAEGEVKETQLKINKPSFSLLSNLFTDKINMVWGKNDFIMFENLDNDNNVDENIFMIMSINK